jgi:hypothetical protein
LAPVRIHCADSIPLRVPAQYNAWATSEPIESGWIDTDAGCSRGIADKSRALKQARDFETQISALQKLQTCAGSRGQATTAAQRQGSMDAFRSAGIPGCTTQALASLTVAADVQQPLILVQQKALTPEARQRFLKHSESA